MPQRRDPNLSELRRSIDCLPRRTREAMLEGVNENRVVTGGYADRYGGVCPMMAASRCGARTNFAVFAVAWDRFTGVHGRSLTRPATPPELKALTIELQASLQDEEFPSDLTTAIAEHEASRRARNTRATGGELDLIGAIADHQAMARARREREASHVDLDFLYDGALPAEPAPREPALV